jgi:hypothetical protein
MSRYLMIRLALVPVVLVIGYIAMYTRRDHASEDERKVSHRLVMNVEGYESGREYYDQLVNDAHDQCFEQCYHLEGTGRHDTSWFDRDEYRRELFRLMIEQAHGDKATGVEAALIKYKNEHIDPPAPSARQKAAGSNR